MIESKPQQQLKSDTEQLEKKRIQFIIPQKYHKEPILFNLASDYQLQVNFFSAILGKDGLGGGCFDIEIKGSRQQIELALNYLSRLNVEIWNREEAEIAGW
ncbi:hypothetical protein NIES4102_28200 [Chondrocystis sp. NIES-4102]|nr:hypothetical protein NIES4102_28200 [Chondrocystis sp. NIES-4102]